DAVLNVADFVRGATGAMNAAAVRARLDALKNRDILLPVWDQRRGQGSWFQYRVERFARVRLTDYLLTGQGWLSFEYRGEARCYDTAPQAFPQSLSTPEDVPLPIVIDGIDEEGQALSYAVIESPRHGRLE